jgi:chromosome segregation ATPase
MSRDELATKKDLADGLSMLREEMGSLEERLTDKLASKEGLAALEKRLYEELASKKELTKTNERLDRLTAIVLQNTDDIKSMKATLEKVVYNQDLFMEALTDLAGDIKDNRLESMATDATLTQHTVRLQDHSDRIRHWSRR